MYRIIRSNFRILGFGRIINEVCRNSIPVGLLKPSLRILRNFEMTDKGLMDFLFHLVVDHDVHFHPDDVSRLLGSLVLNSQNRLPAKELAHLTQFSPPNYRPTNRLMHFQSPLSEAACLEIQDSTLAVHYWFFFIIPNKCDFFPNRGWFGYLISLLSTKILTEIAFRQVKSVITFWWC